MAIEDTAVAELKQAGLSQNRALELLGVAKSSRHYRTKPRPRAKAPIPHRDRPHPAKLTEVEYTTVADLLAESTVSVCETYYQHLDADSDYVASESTFYRVAKAEGIRMARIGPGRKRAKKAGQAVMPQLCATGPGQIVCWDISFLPGLYRGHRYALYLVIDLFSRKIVGWTIEDAEDEITAHDLLELVVDAHRSTIVTVHSDNGAAMTSTRMRTMLEAKRVKLSTIRPGVSNDNAQIESAFRTVKYGPAWPGVFENITEAREWFAEYVRVYNDEHHHSSLAGFTPGQVYDRSWIEVAHRRQERRDAAWEANPHRYRQRPQVKTPPVRVTLNLTNENRSTHAPPTVLELMAP